MAGNPCGRYTMIFQTEAPFYLAAHKDEPHWLSFPCGNGGTILDILAIQHPEPPFFFPIFGRLQPIWLLGLCGQPQDGDDCRILCRGHFPLSIFCVFCAPIYFENLIAVACLCMARKHYTTQRYAQTRTKWSLIDIEP